MNENQEEKSMSENYSLSTCIFTALTAVIIVNTVISLNASETEGANNESAATEFTPSRSIANYGVANPISEYLQELKIEFI